jgi:hypothetical protein
MTTEFEDKADQQRAEKLASMFGDDLPEPEPTTRKLVEVDGWPDREQR